MVIRPLLRVQAMIVSDFIRKEDGKNRDNVVCRCDVMDTENGNECMCAVTINAEVNIENNLQLGLFSSLLKLFRVTVLVCKFVKN